MVTIQGRRTARTGRRRETGRKRRPPPAPRASAHASFALPRCERTAARQTERETGRLASMLARNPRLRRGSRAKKKKKRRSSFAPGCDRRLGFPSQTRDSPSLICLAFCLHDRVSLDEKKGGGGCRTAPLRRVWELGNLAAAMGLSLSLSLCLSPPPSKASFALLSRSTSTRLPRVAT